MNWVDIYLCCLIIGVGLSLIAFVSGSIDLSALHLGHGGLGASDLGHPAALGHAGSPADCSGGDYPAIGGSIFQFGTLAGFLSWFGGTGYILSRVACFEWWHTLPLAACSGTTGAALLLTFVRKILLAHDPTLNPNDYVLTGALATVSSDIRQQGTGEVVISRTSARHWTAARSADGTSLSEGTVVVVLEYHEGVASVIPWDDV